MNANKLAIETFYTAFKNKDYKTMQSCYSDNATFSDPVFTNLNAQQVRAMWEMLISRGTDLKLTYHNVQTQENMGSSDWVAHYTFSATNRKVTNKIHAEFRFQDGKIVEHTDHFSFYAWSRQALGLSGLLLGWTGFLKKKVRTRAKKNLADFINAK